MRHTIQGKVRSLSTFPVNEETGLSCISCDDTCLFRLITRRDEFPPDGVEVADADGTIDEAATAKASEALAKFRERFYGENPPEKAAEIDARQEGG